MKTFLLYIFVIILFSSCSSATISPAETVTSNETSNAGDLQICNIIKTDYTTGFEIKATYEISDHDYNMYNEILDVLESDFSKSEDEILAGLTEKYGMSVSQLKSFLKENMKAAIDRDLGKTLEENTITNSQIIECGTQVIIASLENENINIPSDSKSWEISETGLRYVLQCTFEVDNHTSHEVIIKIEFSDDYSQFNVFQLKYNGINIDL